MFNKFVLLSWGILHFLSYYLPNHHSLVRLTEAGVTEETVWCWSLRRQSVYAAALVYRLARCVAIRPSSEPSWAMFSLHIGWYGMNENVPTAPGRRPDTCEGFTDCQLPALSEAQAVPLTSMSFLILFLSDSPFRLSFGIPL